MVLEWYKEFADWYDNAGSYSSREPMPETYYDFSRWMDAMGKLSPAGLKPYIDFFSHLPYNRKMTVETVSGKTVDYRIVHAFYEYDEGAPKLEQYYTNCMQENMAIIRVMRSLCTDIRRRLHWQPGIR